MPRGPRLDAPDTLRHVMVLHEGSRRAVVCPAREGMAYVALDVGVFPAPRLVALPGVRPPPIHKAAQRGRADRARWDRVLNGKTERSYVPYHDFDVP
jgi:hypothetical protein